MATILDNRPTGGSRMFLMGVMTGTLQGITWCLFDLGSILSFNSYNIQIQGMTSMGGGAVAKVGGGGRGADLVNPDSTACMLFS